MSPAEFTRDPSDPVTQLEFQTWTSSKTAECLEHQAETEMAMKRIATLLPLRRRARLNRRLIRRIRTEMREYSGLLTANRFLAVTTATMTFLLLVAHYPQLAGVLGVLVKVVHG